MSSLQKIHLFIEYWLTIDQYLTSLQYECKSEVFTDKGFSSGKFNYKNGSKGIEIDVVYMPFNIHGDLIEYVYGTIYKKDKLSLSIAKYAQLEFSTPESLSLLQYKGEFEEQLASFSDFFLQLLRSEKMQEILKGNAWNDDYYVPWYHGTNY